MVCAPFHILYHMGASLIAQVAKNPPAMQETLVQFLGWEDPLEKGKATTPVFWPGESHGLYRPRGRKELDMTERLSLSPSTWRQVAPLLAFPSAHKGCLLGPLTLSSCHPSPNLSPAKVLLILQMAVQMPFPLASFT